MDERSAMVILESEMEDALAAMRQGGLARTYKVHRPSLPPVPAVIPALPTESTPLIRSIVRGMSDALAGEAVSVIVPVNLKINSVGVPEAIIAAVTWRDGQMGQTLVQATGIRRDEHGGIAETFDFTPPNVQPFLEHVMGGVLSPVPPDALDVAYARRLLVANGFSPDGFGVDMNDNEVAPPTVH